MFRLKNKFSLLLILLVPIIGLALTACDNRPSQGEAIIEETKGGIEFIEREFSECDETLEATDPENTQLNYVANYRSSSQNQRWLDESFPHEYSLEVERFPLRGSWRKTKSEIMDLVDRMIWSQELGQEVPLLDLFDAALLINVAERTSKHPENASAQRMQVYLRNGSSNALSDWNRSVVWRISSGRPCGQRIATPTGVFKLDPSEHRFLSRYYSRQFDNVDMYETMFLYHVYQNERATGVAIHGTYKTAALGRRDSGGCIRLHRENSKCLFDTFAGNLDETCLPGAKQDYWGRVPSFFPKGGEADPQHLSSGRIEVNGYRVLVVIFEDTDDLIE